MDSSNGPFGWSAGPISVLKDLTTSAQAKPDVSPGAQSSSSDEGLTMSIRRQQASRSTALVQRKLTYTHHGPAQPAGDGLEAHSNSPGGATARKLENKFAAANGAMLGSHGEGMSPSPLSPLSLPGTPTSLLRSVAAPPAEQRRPAVPALAAWPIQAATLQHQGQALASPDSGADSLDALGQLTPMRGLTDGVRQLAEPQAASLLGQSAMAVVEDGRSGRHAAEPYLITNAAFEAYLDSDSTDPDSRESDACTTPRSAIKSQVAGSPWLSRVQTYIQSPLDSTASPARPLTHSAPATLERRPVQATLGAHSRQQAQALMAASLRRLEREQSSGERMASAQRVLFSNEGAPAAARQLGSMLTGQSELAADVHAGEAAFSSSQGAVDAAPERCTVGQISWQESEPDADERTSEHIPGSQVPGVRHEGGSNKAPAAADGMPPPEGKAKGGAPVHLRACGRSETAELPWTPAPPGHMPAAADVPTAAPAAAEQKRSAPTTCRRRGRSWAGCALTAMGLCALLVIVALLAGHLAARSPQQLQALARGSYGPVPASFGRCVRRMQQTGATSKDGSSWADSARLGRQLAVESACAAAAVRREAGVWLVRAQPHASSMGKAAVHQAAAVSQHARGAAGHVISALRPGTEGAVRLAEKLCPGCAAAVGRSAVQMEARLAAWGGAAQRPLDGKAHLHELYHGWLQQGSAPAAVAALCSAAAERGRLAAGALDAWAAQRAAAGHWRAVKGWCGAAGQRLGQALRAAHALLHESALAMLPDEEHAAMLEARLKPAEAAFGLSAVGKRMQGVVDRLLGWGSRQHAEAEQPGAQLKSEGQQDQDAASPAQTHVLRWPLPEPDAGAAAEPGVEAEPRQAEEAMKAPVPLVMMAESADAVAEEQAVGQISTREEGGKMKGHDGGDGDGSCSLQAPCAEDAGEASAADAASLPEHAADGGHDGMQPHDGLADSKAAVPDPLEPEEAMDVKVGMPDPLEPEEAIDTEEAATDERQASVAGESPGAESLHGSAQDAAKRALQAPDTARVDGGSSSPGFAPGLGAASRVWLLPAAWTALGVLLLSGVAAAAHALKAPQALGRTGRRRHMQEQAVAGPLAHGHAGGEEVAGLAEEEVRETRAAQTEKLPRRIRAVRIAEEAGEEATSTPTALASPRRASGRRGGAKSAPAAPATAPPLTRSRAARFSTAPAAAETTPLQDAPRTAARKTRRSIGFDKGGRG